MKLIPKPNSIKKMDGYFNANHLYIKKTVDENIATIQELLVTDFLAPQEKVKISESGNVFFLLNKRIEHPEGYELIIDQDCIKLTASKSAGLFYGGITLSHILKQYQKKIPCCRISDFPRFKWRGMHLDVSRHFFGIDFIKRYIDLLASLKLNMFHWHLTDDNGWRIEIKKYPLLTKISAFRTDLEHLLWNERDDKEAQGNGIYGGFYTQNEIKEVVNYARERFITIIPEIEMPGHSREVFAAYPQFSCLGKKLTVAPGGYWPNTDIFCAGNDDTFEFLENVLKEVIELFPGKYIHIGGDETNKTNWKNCPKCQQRIADENLKDEKELQSYFIKQIEKFLISQNKKLIGWDEITEGGLADDAVVMCWRGDGIDAARAAVLNGNEAVMCPNPFLYFDWKQTETENEQGAFGVTTLEKVYNYEPIPEELAEEQKQLILGAQANVWTEWMPTEEDVEYMIIPRIYALAEIVWTTSEKDFSDFQNRLIL